MKRIVLSLVLLGFAACSPGERDGDIGEDGAVDAPEPEEAPEAITADHLSEWQVRLDDPEGDEAGFQLLLEDGGLSVTTGPAGIAWRPVDQALGGDFTASATFVQRGATEGNTEGYGIMVGGKNLDAPDQEYTYFLVRSTGEYLIKRREGEETRDLVAWKRPADGAARGPAARADTGAATDAGAPAPGGGEAGRPAAGQEGSAAPAPGGRTLSVRVQGEEVHFQIDGRTVETLPRSEVEPYGTAGVRINHRLDVQVTGWSLEGDQVGRVGGEGGDEGGEDGREAPAAGEARDTAR